MNFNQLQHDQISAHPFSVITGFYNRKFQRFESCFPSFFLKRDFSKSLFILVLVFPFKVYFSFFFVFCFRKTRRERKLLAKHQTQNLKKKREGTEQQSEHTKTEIWMGETGWEGGQGRSCDNKEMW